MDITFSLTPSRTERLQLLQRMLRRAYRAVDKVRKRGDLRPAAEMDDALRDIDAMLWVMGVTGDYDNGCEFLTDRWLRRLAGGEMTRQRPREWWERRATDHNFSNDGEPGDLDAAWLTEEG